MIDAAEVLIDDGMSKKGQRFMAGMAEAAPAGSVTTRSYAGRHRVLMLYGPGAPRKLPLVGRHRERGGRVVMWDIGYWDRQANMRLSIDSLHPTRKQLALAPDGPGRREFTLRDDANADGPILLIGLGFKSLFAYGLGRMLQWEQTKVRDLKRRYPGKVIEWRPKGSRPILLARLPMRWGMPIEDALRGCSLVVCRHSNVAIDACIAGVPVECEDGAAYALYRNGTTPTVEQRAEFLRRLSWWQWSAAEAPAAWAWIDRVIAGQEAEAEKRSA